jgi:glycosyltransferase involved in cell wall biosynthesis
VRIFADIRCLQDPNYSRRGVGSHAQFLLQAIRHHAGPELRIIGLTDPDIGPVAADHAALCDELRATFRIAASERPAIFLQLSPMTHDTRPVAALLGRPGVTSVSVIYDFIPLQFPERYLAERAGLYGYAAAMQWLQSYQCFLPISSCVARETSRRLGIASCRMHVTGVALRAAFEERLGQAGRGAPERAGGRPRVLFSGGGDPRKNLSTVVHALRLLSDSESHPVLEIVGCYPQDMRRAQLGRVPDGSLVFHDHLSDSELVERYSQATLAVVASRAEGFSIPVVEAIACRCPVVVSDIPAHRELVTDSCARFAADDADGLATLMGRFLASPADCEALRDIQYPVAEKFTADAVGDRVWNAFQQPVLRAFPAPHATQPRIAFVTPYPPDRSGVADYSLQTVNALSRLADVDVYTDQPNPKATPGVRRFYPISAAAWLRPDYDGVVAVLGNSHYHNSIYELHCRYGGVCIVHDNRLLDMLFHWKGERYVQQLASRALSRDVATTEIHSWMQDPGSLPLMFFDEVLGRARPLIVHSRGIQQNLERLSGVRAEYLPFCIYRDLTSEEGRSVGRKARAELGIDDEVVVVVTFGYVADAKRPDICVSAVGELRRSGQNAHLYFVGQISSDVQQRLTEQSAGIDAADAIHFTGDWADETVYRGFLAAADLGIQLRSHFLGGLSGALLDCIAAGIPTVANRDLATALAAPDYVAAVSDYPTGSEVAAALKQLLNVRRDSTAHSVARDRYVGEHSFDRYAVELLKLLNVQ